jgi:hypothetical protein
MNLRRSDVHDDRPCSNKTIRRLAQSRRLFYYRRSIIHHRGNNPPTLCYQGISHFEALVQAFLSS